MQITPRAILLAVALLASAPLLAARNSTSSAGTDAPAQESPATAEQDDCTLPTLPPTDLSSDKFAGLLPKPGSTPPDTTEVERRLNKAASCVRPLGLWAPGEGTNPSTIAKETIGPTSDRTTPTQFSSPAPVF
jgi:predicted small secreted protein